MNDSPTPPHPDNGDDADLGIDGVDDGRSAAEPSGWQGYGDGRTWIDSSRPSARRLGQPIRQFLRIESAAGVVLVVATVAALVLANIPSVGHQIAEFWHTDLVIFEFKGFKLEETLGHWVNDGLMVIFFFVVGLEIKFELVNGELKDPRRAAVPAIAAVGGMIAPAAIFFLLNAGGAFARGWGIPMATDIAFAVSVLVLLGSRVPSQLKVFLLTLAIVDDIGAILVIALFYTDAIDLEWLLSGVGLIGLVVLLRLIRVWYVPIYLVIGIGVWLCFLESGVHATIAGVILGLIAPAKPFRPSPAPVTVHPDTTWELLRSTLFDAKETVPVAERLQHLLHPWSAFVVLPIFAFANAGIELSGDAFREAITSTASLGVFFGLLIGKPIGVFAATFAAVKLGIGRMPTGVTWRHIFGAGVLAGIGFTVALFVAGLAFDDPFAVDLAKIAILAASIVAACLGSLLLISADRYAKT